MARSSRLVLRPEVLADGLLDLDALRVELGAPGRFSDPAGRAVLFRRV